MGRNITEGFPCKLQCCSKRQDVPQRTAHPKAYSRCLIPRSGKIFRIFLFHLSEGNVKTNCKFSVSTLEASELPDSWGCENIKSYDGLGQKPVNNETDKSLPFAMQETVMNASLSWDKGQATPWDVVLILSPEDHTIPTEDLGPRMTHWWPEEY